MMKKILIALAALLGLVVLLVVVCDLRVSGFARGRLYSDLASVPHRHAALLLGTS